jgi:hypothetical protein
LLGANLAGFGISFAAQPPRVSVFIMLFGVVLLITNAPPRLWLQLMGSAFLIAGSVGLLSIVMNEVRRPITSDIPPGTWTGYALQGVVYAIFLALGWGERRHRALMAVE